MPCEVGCRETAGVKALYSMLASTTSGRANELVKQGLCKTAGVAMLSDVFQFRWTSSDSLEDKWLRWLKLMRQVDVTSLGDDARETLTIAGLEKAKERSLEQHLRLRAPQTWTVLCASVDQYLRKTVDSCSQPTPMEIGAVVSTCACCGKAGHEKARCRFRNAKCSNCGKTGHLRAMCNCSGKGGTSRRNRVKCYCCGQVGHRRLECPRRNESCSQCGKRSIIVFNACETTVGAFGTLSGISPMASVGKAHSCLLAQSPETPLQIMPIEDEIVDEGIDDEAVEVQRPNVVVVRRGPTKLEVDHHVAAGHAQHRTWCDACMKVRGIAGIRKTGPWLRERGPICCD